MTLYVDFELGTDANTDQILAQMRSGQANSQLPSQVTQQGVIVQPGTTAPFMLLDLYSANGRTTTSSWPTTPPSTCSTR